MTLENAIALDDDRVVTCHQITRSTFRFHFKNNKNRDCTQQAITLSVEAVMAMVKLMQMVAPDPETKSTSEERGQKP